MFRARGEGPTGGASRPARPDRSAPGGRPAPCRQEMYQTVPRKEPVP